MERAQDIFHPEQGEVWAPPADLGERVTRQLLLRERHKRPTPPPSIPPISDPTWRSDQKMNSRHRQAYKNGMADGSSWARLGSPGRARGIARGIAGSDDFHRFQPGDVLVAHTTTPVWTPLFNIARAAVTEVGGPFSHAAIVAREFGIPLVTGAIEATHVIADGAPMVVNGSAGIVEL